MYVLYSYKVGASPFEKFILSPGIGTFFVTINMGLLRFHRIDALVILIRQFG